MACEIVKARCEDCTDEVSALFEFEDESKTKDDEEAFNKCFK